MHHPVLVGTFLNPCKAAARGAVGVQAKGVRQQPGKRPPARATMPRLPIDSWSFSSSCCSLHGPSSGDANSSSTVSDSRPAGGVGSSSCANAAARQTICFEDVACRLFVISTESTSGTGTACKLAVQYFASN